jgi:acetylornithine deacetylase
LTATVANIVSFLASKERDILALTEALIAAPSPNPGGNELVAAAVIQSALGQLGLPKAEVLAGDPNRPNLMLRLDAAQPGPHLAICGHLDTKPVGDAASDWRTDPFTPTVEGDRLFGLGATDMKGAVAAMLFAAAAYAAVANQAAGSLTLLLTADEEYGSLHGAAYLARSGALAGIDAIVLGEPCGLTREWEAIRTVSRGFCGFEVHVEGTQTHSSISDALPSINGIEAMARILVALRRELRPRFPIHPLCPTGPTINLGVKVLGGVTYGVLPGHAEFWSDIRTTPGMTFEALRDDLEAALARAAPEADGAKVKLVFPPNLAWVDATEISADHPVTRAVQAAAARVLGAAPPLALFHGATDAWAFQGIGGVPTLAAFGPGQLPLAHGPNEWVSIPSLLQASQMYALTALNFGQEQ